MKELFIVRHAKSSWDNPGLADRDRPLNKRGHRNAPEMGKRLKKRGVKADLMLSSPAIRALSTARYISKEIGYPEGAITISPLLYHTSPSELLRAITEMEDKHTTVLIFGHNPGFTDFANQLTNSVIYNIPTAGIVHCSLDVDHWKEVTFGKAKLRLFDYPKKTIT